MRTLPRDASDDQIRSVVLEWSELLAREDYAGALGLLPSSTEEYSWTPELLQRAINGYGVPNGREDTLKMLLEEWEVDRFVVSTLEGRADKDEVVAQRIDVDREGLYGLDPQHYLGMVHYNDVPLSGYTSDLTARFHIKKVGDSELTLEFLDIHVM